ncbi:MAG: hypothetical protein NZM00_04565, partial [Anaerolinea sp.]|nr:hypothetical protein [Anaerolinea sp.]
VTFPLTARGSAFAVFPAQTDDRVDLIVESALDTEMMVISPLLTTTTADGDSGRGLNPELTQYWVRDSGYEYVYLANLSAAAGDVTLRVIDNPIPDVTIDGTVITISPNLRQPMPIFRLRYTAGSDYFIEIETIDGSPTGHPFVQLFRNGEAGELIRGEQAARIGYAFHAHEDGEIIFTIQDNTAPSNEYRVRGGAYFAG